MATSIVRSTANRAVHMRIIPRPSNLGESREILRLISQFGEVEYFKNLKYDTLSAPNTTLVIFKEEEAAKYCLHKSPIRFRMGKTSAGEQATEGESETAAPEPANAVVQPQPAPEPATPLPRGPIGAPFGLTQSRSISTSALPDPPDRPSRSLFEPPPPPLLESRIFQIQANAARANFRDLINMAHYHGSFAIDTKSIPHQDLKTRVPSLGLSCVDWRAEGKPWRIMLQEKQKEKKGPERRKSLAELYDEGPEASATSSGESLPE